MQNEKVKKRPKITLKKLGNKDLSEIVKKIEVLLKPYQHTLDIGIAKDNDSISAITLNVEFKF